MAGKHQTTDASHLRALKASGVQPEEIAEVFGVHLTAVHRWISKDVAPKWTVAASKAFGGNSADILVVGVISKEKWKMAERAFAALGFEKVGQRNL